MYNMRQTDTDFGYSQMTNALVPIVVERTGVGERSYDIYSRLMMERIIILNGPVNEVSANILVAQLLFLHSQDKGKPIEFYINSPGGVVTDGMSVYDTMQWIMADTPISTLVIGQAASMGSFLAQAGTPGLRFVMPSSRTMTHQPSGGTRGQVTDMRIHHEETERIKEMLIEGYVRHNSKGKTYQEIYDTLERDKFFSPQEAVDFGLADGIKNPGPVFIPKL